MKSLRFPVALVLVWAIWGCCRALGADEPIAGTFDANGVKIRYIVQGKGEPVVLIHGLYSSAEINWKLTGVMAALARDHQVIALDLPGHGGSDRPQDANAYGVRMAEDVVLLMDHLNIPKAQVVGYSLGGMIVVKLLATHGDRFTAAVIGGMGWLREGGALSKIWEDLGARQGPGAPTPAVCVSEIGRLGVTEEQLKAIKVPSIILVGDHDIVKKLYVDPLLAVRRDWQVVEIEGAGHLTCIARKQFVDELIAWVGKNTEKETPSSKPA